MLFNKDEIKQIKKLRDSLIKDAASRELYKAIELKYDPKRDFNNIGTAVFPTYAHGIQLFESGLTTEAIVNDLLKHWASEKEGVYVIGIDAFDNKGKHLGYVTGGLDYQEIRKTYLGNHQGSIKIRGMDPKMAQELAKKYSLNLRSTKTYSIFEGLAKNYISMVENERVGRNASYVS